jgi:isocitrate dehydrogenase
MKFPNKITIAYGDGIGPEIMEATLKILQHAKVNLAIDTISIGQEQYERKIETGIPDSAWETIKNNQIILKAPITTPQGKGYKSLNVTLRKALGLYANIRPVKSYYPFVNSNFPEIDLVIVRENEEDLYSGIEYKISHECYESLKLITRSGSNRINKFAFDYAIKNNRQKISCFIKDNIMKLSDGAFHKSFTDIAKFYPEISTEQMIIDIASAKIAVNPARFDVIVTENLYGDIISDIAAEVSGSVGLCGSANIGDNYAMFEAIHGSAPDIAGKNIANPSGLINASLMMLRHICKFAEADLIENALNYTIEQGFHTADLFNPKHSKEKLGTQEFAEKIIKHLGKKPKKLILKENSNNNYCETRSAEPKNSELNTTNRELVGVDIFIDYNNNNLDDLVTNIKNSCNNLLLNLQSISSKGLKIWPENRFPPPACDILICRFVSKEPSKIIKHKDITDLLNGLLKNKLSFSKTQNLYIYDGKIGFSV